MNFQEVGWKTGKIKIYNYRILVQQKTTSNPWNIRKLPVLNIKIPGIECTQKN